MEMDMDTKLTSGQILYFLQLFGFRLLKQFFKYQMELAPK